MSTSCCVRHFQDIGLACYPAEPIVRVIGVLKRLTGSSLHAAGF